MAGFVLVDEAGQISAITPEAEALLGFSAGSGLRQPLASLPSELQELAGPFLQAQDHPASASSVQHRIRLNQNFVIHCRVLPVRTASGSAQVGLVLSGLGPTGDLERNLFHLDRLASLGALSTGAAHELRNALVAVKTFIDLLLEKNQEAELAELVRREMSRIDSLVLHMLKFAGAGIEPEKPVRLCEVIDRTLRLLQPQITGKAIQVDRNLADEADEVRGDAGQLQQALLNLFLNSLDAMAPGGRLAVGLCPGGNSGKPELELRISDTGIGIPPENMGRLFEPFFTTKPNGTGLGLAISRRIIQGHSGTITAISPPGQGATFIIRLPTRLRDS